MKLLAISGALRTGSRNTALLREAIRLGGVNDAEFADLRLPLYDGDLEDRVGLPAEVKVLCDQIRAADALLFSTPEYNKMIPGVLKNALDWASREKPQPLMGKPVAIVSTGGRSGGEVAQFTLRHALTSFNVDLVGGSGVIVPFGGKAFDAEDRLVDPVVAESVTALMKRLRDSVRR